MGDNTRSFRFITLLNQANQPHHDHDLELDEADMFYSSSTATINSSYGYRYGTPPSVDHDHYALTHRNFGLSALLADDDGEEEDVIATAPQPVPCFGHHVNGIGPHRSAPQAVPTWHSRTGYSWGSEERRDNDDDEAFSQESEIVPPHVMVAQSQTSSAFSVLEGAGRTLKGRDLRRVRNAVWQKTGFLNL